MMPPISNEAVWSAYTYFTNTVNQPPGKVGIPKSAFEIVFKQIIDQDNWHMLKEYSHEPTEPQWYIHSALIYMIHVFNSAETRCNRMMFREEKLTWKGLRYLVEECAARPWESWLVLLSLEKLTQ